ncbi:heterocyst frequency control protein PatD [Roseofilum casamattae]|uniref:Heterocyst frequency control protein PatD n=1 Tax=Roseofilum casamattae BLCC-M143 TaxID=3022442 RepID=A0ABT7BXY0_9CYAN|nr:heterocyst frequency control protein PatD [Roseofilum casamattae]MDJ1183379.1 heterocyst frequency control protein PatD [Roseofilum casamattae BLCC-M143]
MLSERYKQVYECFVECLQQLSEVAIAPASAEELVAACDRVQDFFVREIAELTGEEEGKSVAPLWQSVHTEMHREMKLLMTEMTFYRIARSPGMQEQRKIKIGDRSGKLISYCHTILEID